MNEPARTTLRLWTRRALLAGALAAPMARGAVVGAQPAGRGLPILAYHRFDAARAAPTTITVRAFEAQLDSLARNGYRIDPLGDAVAALRAGVPDGAQATITVDDGHRTVYTTLFPILLERRLPVTLFIYPSAISNASYAMTWEQLGEMRASGLVEVQSHSFWHPNFNTERRRRSATDYRAFVDDQLQRSKRVLETRLGTRVDMLAWPFGIVDPDLEEAARRAGYSAAFAYGGGPAMPGVSLFALPRIPVGDADQGDRFAALLHPPAAGARR